MCRVPPDGILLLKVFVTAFASSFTSLCILVDAAAAPPSTARNALVIAIAIFSASYETTDPFLLMTLICPGAIAGFCCSCAVWVVFSVFSAV